MALMELLTEKQEVTTSFTTRRRHLFPPFNRRQNKHIYLKVL